MPTSALNVTYPEYLRLSVILSAQHPLGPEAELGESVHAAEHFFIVVHQAFELWFKQALLDLQNAVHALTRDPSDPELALDHLQRVGAIQRLLVQQMVLFDHLSPRSFLAFRPFLGTASGFESAQWRDVQEALGVQGSGGSPIYQAFQQAVAARGLSLLDVYREPSRAGVLYRLAESLVDISEQFWQMTAAHVQIAERTIGDRPGTGGTSGVMYLTEALKVKAFPDLWHIRTAL